MPVSPARSAAFDILLRVERETSYACDLLHSSPYQRLLASDHGLATELVMGVLRWRPRLDDEIASASSQSLEKLDIEVLTALRLTLYQLRWLDRIPRHAALNEGVELVKRARKRSAAPFVNAILRKLSAARKDPLAENNPGSSPELLARAFAQPLWLVERWVQEYGPAATHAICEFNQTVPVTAIRLRAPDVDANLTRAGIILADGALLASARRVQRGDITKTQAYRAGQITIHDEASQLVATLIGRGAKAGTRILDCCSAPGGKTLAIADRNPGTSITAVELHRHRARLLQKLMRGAPSAAQVQVIVGDARQLPTSQSFERVLADVPCSGTGTLARNPEIKWHLTPADLAQLHARQSAILRSALAQVRPGGRLIYSTCSLEREENENVVDEVLAKNNTLRLLNCRTELERLKAEGELIWPNAATLTRGPYLRTIPGVQPCEGFFVAMVERF